MNGPLAVVPSAHTQPVVLLVLVLTYVGIAIGRIPGLKVNRTGIAILGAIAMMVFAPLSIPTAVSYVNWPTLFVLFGFFVISAQLRLSGFYAKVADGVARQLTRPARFLLILMATSAGLAALLNNDVVCWVFAPIVGAAILRQGRDPVPFLIALAISANLGAAATLVGNGQNMMIGEVAHLSFGRYLAWSIAPVAFSLAAAYGVIRGLSGKRLAVVHPAPPEDGSVAVVPYDRAHTLKGLIILGFVVGLFFCPVPRPIVALAAAAIHLASPKFRTDALLGLVDWPILLLFTSLFVVTGTFESIGYGRATVDWLARSGVSLQAPHQLIVITAALSNLIGNAPTVMLLTKVVSFARPETAYVLAMANSFSGNLIMTASVANLIVAQKAQDLGVEISFREYARLGIPVTLVALSTLLLWAMVLG